MKLIKYIFLTTNNCLTKNQLSFSPAGFRRTRYAGRLFKMLAHSSTQLLSSKMKKLLSIAGGFFFVLILVVASFFGYAAYQGRGLDASSKAYVETNVPPIISSWSKDELLKRSSPQLIEIINENPDQLEQLFQKLTKLGALQTFGEVIGEATISITAQNGKVITAEYMTTAKFENGEGQISVRLIQSPSGQWQILLFGINSPIFLQ